MNTDKIYAESVANEYSVKNDTKVVALRKLDRKVKDFPLAFALSIGIVFTLVMGTGMCFTMGVLGNETEAAFLFGIVLGVVGIIGMVANYPIYKKILAGRKEKYAGDIIQLANEISREV